MAIGYTPTDDGVSIGYAIDDIIIENQPPFMLLPYDLNFIEDTTVIVVNRIYSYIDHA